MINTLSEAADCMQGILHGEDRAFDGICTDTRSLREGELFFALQGPNFDGRDYVGSAKSCGVAGAVVSTRVADDIAVDDVNVQSAVELKAGIFLIETDYGGVQR